MALREVMAMMTNSDAEYYRKILSYDLQFTGYILKRANQDSKVELAIEISIIVNAYQAMALVLAPKCPEEFQAQVDALEATLDKVFEYLHSDGYNKETESQLRNEIIARDTELFKFTGRCAGLEVIMRENQDLDMIEKLSKELGAPKKKVWEMETIRKGSPPPLPSPPSPKLIEQAQELARALESYHNQLVDYILQKTNRDMSVPFALMGLEVSYLHNTLAPLFLFTADPSPCVAFFTGESLDYTVDVVLKDFVRALNVYQHAEKPEDLSLEHGVEYLIDLYDAVKDYISWRADFLNVIATCFGVQLFLVPVPKGNSMEITIMRYEPLKPDTEPGSQEAPAS